MKAILTNWSIMRGLRLLLGIAALVQSIAQKDISIGILAGFLLLTAITNIGCCGSGGCAVNVNAQKRHNNISHIDPDNQP